MKLLNPRALTKVAMPGQPATDGSSSNEPARRAGAMRPSLLAVDLLRSLLARILRETPLRSERRRARRVGFCYTELEGAVRAADGTASAVASD